MDSLIVCEGYQDRAFLSAWVDWIGKRDQLAVRKTEKAAQRVKADGAYVKELGPRQLCIAPAKSFENVTQHAVDLLKGREDSIDRVCLVVDADDKDPAERRKSVSDSVRSKGYTRPIEVLIWKPTLEKLIEKALRVVDSPAMQAVDAFLAAAPGHATTGKEPAFSYCAAWRPDFFGESFFGFAWQDEHLRGALESMLAAEAQLLVGLLNP